MADVQIAPQDLVETATHELLNGQPDWGTNMSLIDLVNLRPQTGPVVLAALKKRLQHKKHAIGLLAIILLESLVKNCVSIVSLVSQPEFLDDLVHTLPKQIRDPHNKSIFTRDQARDILAVERYDKTLLAIESWAKTWAVDSEAVRRNRSLLSFTETYRALQRAGVHFPAPERDELAPVTTPQKNQQVADKKAAAQRQQLEELAAAERARQAAAAPPKPAAFKYSDAACASVVDTCTLLSDLLTESPEREDLRRNELVQQLVETLRPQTAKIAERLSQEAHSERPNEKLLAELLQANEVCVESAAYYDGLLKGTMRRKVAVVPAPSPAAASPARPPVSVSPAASPAASPGGLSGLPPRKSSTEKKPVVPLLQPPPASSTRQRQAGASSPGGSSAAAASPAHAAAAASPAKQSLLDLDLLFSPPAAAAAASSSSSKPQQQAAAPAEVDFFAPPAAASASQSSASASSRPAQRQQPPPEMEPQETSGETSGGPAIPVYEQQKILFQRAEEQKRLAALQAQQRAAPAVAASSAASSSSSSARPAVASPNKSSFMLAPPPAAAGPSADFFASAGVTSPPGAAKATGVRRPPPPLSSMPVVATPFDSPEPADPFAALAMRSSPPANAAKGCAPVAAPVQPAKKKDNALDMFANLKF